MAIGKILVVGGGGSGGTQNGSNNANGGNAGAYNANDSFTLTDQSYPIVVGSGGIGASAASNQNGNAGGQSTGFGVTSSGGDGGASSGTGADGSGSATANSISGSSVTYSIGGGHETALKSNTTPGSGSDGRNSVATLAGKDGIVIVSYLTADANSATTGGTITTNGAYTVHTFTSNGTFTFVSAYSLSASVGNFSLTGYSTILNYGRKLIMGNGSFSLTGQALSFTLRLYTRVTNRIKNSTIIINKTKNSASSVTNRVKNATTVTNRPKS